MIGFYATVLAPVPTSGPIFVREDGTTSRQKVNVAYPSPTAGDRVVVVPVRAGTLMCAVGKVH